MRTTTTAPRSVADAERIIACVVEFVALVEGTGLENGKALIDVHTINAPLTKYDIVELFNVGLYYTCI
jgi:hypothetical protein